MQFHEAANLFPMMDDSALAELVADIREHGLREPVVLHPDGRVLDGRNRLRACDEAGVPPHFTTWKDDGNPVAYVVSLNMHRRHLSESQRGMVAARIANMQHGGDRSKMPIGKLPTEQPRIFSEPSREAPTPPPISRTQAAEMLNTSPRTVARATEVISKGVPEVVEAVDTGRMSVSAAAEVVKLAPEVQKEIVVNNKPHVAHNSGDNEWYTPQEFIDGAREVMGGIDCDPATSEAANATVQASVFYTAETNGLAQRWQGRVWMNPPYASDLIGKFCQKLVDSLVDGDVTQAMVLVNNATETRWFQQLADHATAILFPAGRVRFWHPDKSTAAPLQGQALLYFGDEVEQFSDTFGERGFVCVLG